MTINHLPATFLTSAIAWWQGPGWEGDRHATFEMGYMGSGFFPTYLSHNIATTPSGKNSSWSVVWRLEAYYGLPLNLAGRSLNETSHVVCHMCLYRHSIVPASGDAAHLYQWLTQKAGCYPIWHVLPVLLVSSYSAQVQAQRSGAS